MPRSSGSRSGVTRATSITGNSATSSTSSTAKGRSRTSSRSGIGYAAAKAEDPNCVIVGGSITELQVRREGFRESLELGLAQLLRHLRLPFLQRSGHDARRFGLHSRDLQGAPCRKTALGDRDDPGGDVRSRRPQPGGVCLQTVHPFARQRRFGDLLARAQLALSLQCRQDPGHGGHRLRRDSPGLRCSPMPP